MESTGQPGRIHISKTTANLLEKSGKSNWFVARHDQVVVKGKGQMATFWLRALASTSSSGSSHSSNDHSGSVDMTGETLEDQIEIKSTRLTGWAVEIMQKALVDIEAHRRAFGQQKVTLSKPDARQETTTPANDGTVIDEVKEIIRLPHYENAESSVAARNDVVLDEKVRQQLENYTQAIAAMYNPNAFHNFEHALHVMSSTVKLLNRIRAPEIETEEESDAILHDSTFGITSDPLTQFACIFSALIHDGMSVVFFRLVVVRRHVSFEVSSPVCRVCLSMYTVDHMGVPNARLVAEGQPLADYYKGKSVAEQNSIDMSWQLLMDPVFVDLRAAIYQTPEEKQRFRQLVVNAVLATDIVDKELKALRNARWAKAFETSAHNGRREESPKDAVDRKATIVIEHLIQASDVAHTMQHWHVFRKWNERLFQELRSAYREGRADTDPADFWYKGEIGFFDFYIIPLAKKLKECGVFGVSSDEYLNYAVHNRDEWAARGMEIVAEMKQKYPL